MITEVAIANALRMMGFKNGDVVYFDGDTLSFNRPKADPEAWREDYRKKQAAGVKFQNRCGCFWQEGNWNFEGDKEDYREVPQPSHDGEYPTTATGAPFEWIAPRQMPQPLPHAAERALWKAQREAGTNEVWQCWGMADMWCDLDNEPKWYSDTKYRVKPMKLTAKICRVGKAYPMSYSGQDWQFFGTREEYRAEFEKYGYVVMSNIEEVKPKTVKYYFALFVHKHGHAGTASGKSLEEIKESVRILEAIIIGDIEEREIEV